METKDIEKLLRKYYDGLTSEAEERLLEEFFAGTDIPRELAEDREYFTALDAVRKSIPTPSGLERKLNTALDAEAANAAAHEKDAEHGAAGTQKRPARRTRLASIARQLCGMAASVAVVASLGAYLITRNNDAAKVEQATYAQAKAAILKFSSTLNKGFAQMEKAQEKTEDVGERINQCIELN